MKFKPSPWMIRVARIGQLAKGLLFVSIGLLSALAAFQGRGGGQDSRGAMRSIGEQPFGRVLLIAIIGGLVCYVLSHIVAAIADLEQKGSDAKALALRAGMLFTAGIYSSMTAAAVKTLLGTSSGGGGDESARDWTARAMSTPFGSCFVILTGIAVIGGGLFQCFCAYRGRFTKKLKLTELRAATRHWIVRICAFGLGARGMVFCVVGVFLIQAGLRSDPQEARGLGGALNALQAQPLGRWLFSLVAIGLAAYGLYCCVRARYGRFGER